jgi:hypothetical protein
MDPNKSSPGQRFQLLVMCVMHEGCVALSFKRHLAFAVFSSFFSSLIFFGVLRCIISKIISSTFVSLSLAFSLATSGWLVLAAAALVCEHSLA